MSIYRKAVNNPVTTALVFVALAFFGVFSLINISIDRFPKFDANVILVMGSYPGASAEDIDTAMILGCNHPMGPLHLGDYIGLDICLAIMEVIYAETGDSKYRPSPLLRKMVRAGKLGCKTGKGFFDYSK